MKEKLNRCQKNVQLTNLQTFSKKFGSITALLARPSSRREVHPPLHNLPKAKITLAKLATLYKPQKSNQSPRAVSQGQNTVPKRFSRKSLKSPVRRKAQWQEDPETRLEEAIIANSSPRNL